MATSAKVPGEECPDLVMWSELMMRCVSDLHYVELCTPFRSCASISSCARKAVLTFTLAKSSKHGEGIGCTVYGVLGRVLDASLSRPSSSIIILLL